MQACRHLEVSGFSIYSVDLGCKVQVMTLGRCVSCNEFLTLDGSIVPSNTIISRGSSVKAKMRTVTAQLNSDIYEKLEALAVSETGSNDISKILNEVAAVGLKHHEKHIS